ncbi:type II toxin-antitoxin system RelE/ParE family toxin [Lutispora sp.]|uniref:type II toxin-antitoxin system RelE/ParE family toxin n=1 Tax=Lutispora sp. TaxID=2828727 RepID=UPI000ECCF4F9|nr:type II toxin-antitoxin system mRNA interferase toxin, RelE/StbE family [Clostridiaceae bacterium]
MDKAYKLIVKRQFLHITLSPFPYKGVVPKDFFLRSKGYRMLVIDSYIVFYLVTSLMQTIEIMRVVSGKQNYKSFL